MKAIDNQLMLEFKIKPIKSKLSAMPLVGIALLFLGFCSCSPMRRAFYVRKQDASYEVSPCMHLFENGGSDVCCKSVL